MRPGTLVRAAALLMLAATVGCNSARFVEVRPDGGVVAIPNNSNDWPYHYRDKAKALMRQKCPSGYVIDHEEEVVTGSVTHTDAETETQKSPTLLVGGVDEQSNRSGHQGS